MKCYACGSENVDKKDNLVQCLDENCGQAFQIIDKKPKPAEKSVLERMDERLTKIEGEKNKKGVNDDVFPC